MFHRFGTIFGSQFAIHVLVSYIPDKLRVFPENALLRSVFFFIFLLPSILTAEGIQRISSFDTITRLDSNADHSWEITEESLDPQEYSRAFLRGEDTGIRTDRYNVPGVHQASKEEVQKVYIIKKFIAPETWTAPGLSVRLGTLSDKDKTYLNGRLIGETGDMNSTEPQAYDKVRIYEFPSSIIRKGEMNILVIEVKKYFHPEVGIEQDRTEIGDTQLIEQDYYRSEYTKIALLMIYFTVASYFLFLFVRRRTDTENLYFGLFTIFLVLYQFLRNQIKYDLGISFLYMKKTEYIILTALIPVFANFVRAYFKFPRNIYANLLDGVYGIFVIFYLVSNDVLLYNKLNNFGVQFGWSLYIILVFYYLIGRILKKDKDAILILAGVAVVGLSTILDSLSNRNIFVFPRTVGYTFFFFVISIATILANKFVRLNEQVEELNEHLEHKVEERTQELNESLAHVNKLKTQQDGDYFLTSLLIQPLFTNQNESSKLKIDFFSKQKKSILFKNKQYEIGGDISIAGNISIRGEKHSVFVNGDAMGKSIQGAGGALVMGTVFQSLLSRTNRNGGHTRSPESWLKESFLELQSIFESFDGSMYISVVIGLLNERTGGLHYINAEHPWPVLYRDAQASFLDNEMSLRKIGIPGNENGFEVRFFQLRKHDVLILGSDGKDDLLIGNDDRGRIVNEDETRFLKTVELAEGDLEKIYNETLKFGELTDDFTLLRLEYLVEPQIESVSLQDVLQKAGTLFKEKSYDSATEYLEKYANHFPDQEEFFLLLGKSYLKRKEYALAAKNFEKAADLNPKRIESQYYASYGNKLNKDFQKAEHFGKITYRLDSNLLPNLVNLADIYKNLNKSEDAKQFVQKAKQIDPNHPSVLRLADIF
ncbi:stage II sporulation protein E [Leptospira langatensis]|uniref:Stage II sporulation protein E n=1 Tax=Leptospira langatensis TaxID=2484983 RepID=A0A5F1ZN78_9LEPT|nr:SpoIIE family protein phosphatase [Leptospira langatensis]TGK05221.1 stage II sporulation protein E [Leptospira langatensis]TGL38357.1 stage II sporulation protein E [Leptospira langatensis]